MGSTSVATLNLLVKAQVGEAVTGFREVGNASDETARKTVKNIDQQAEALRAYDGMITKLANKAKTGSMTEGDFAIHGSLTQKFQDPSLAYPTKPANYGLLEERRELLRNIATLQNQRLLPSPPGAPPPPSRSLTEFDDSTSFVSSVDFRRQGLAFGERTAAEREKARKEQEAVDAANAKERAKLGRIPLPLLKQTSQFDEKSAFVDSIDFRRQGLDFKARQDAEAERKRAEAQKIQDAENAAAEKRMRKTSLDILSPEDVRSDRMERMRLTTGNNVDARAKAAAGNWQDRVRDQYSISPISGSYTRDVGQSLMNANPNQSWRGAPYRIQDIRNMDHLNSIQGSMLGEDNGADRYQRELKMIERQRSRIDPRTYGALPEDHNSKFSGKVSQMDINFALKLEQHFEKLAAAGKNVEVQLRLVRERIGQLNNVAVASPRTMSTPDKINAARESADRVMRATVEQPEFAARLRTMDTTKLKEIRDKFRDIQREGKNVEMQIRTVDQAIKDARPPNWFQRNILGHEAAVNPRTPEERQRTGAGSGMRNFRYSSQMAAYGFEDFMVGMQTGGVAGGVRGLTNNITAITGQIQNTRMMVAATMGATVGMLALPKIMEWIEACIKGADNTDRFRESIDKLFDAASQKRELNKILTEGDYKKTKGELDETKDKRAESQDNLGILNKEEERIQRRIAELQEKHGGSLGSLGGMFSSMRGKASAGVRSVFGDWAASGKEVEDFAKDRDEFMGLSKEYDELIKKRGEFNVLDAKSTEKMGALTGATDWLKPISDMETKLKQDRADFWKDINREERSTGRPFSPEELTARSQSYVQSKFSEIDSNVNLDERGRNRLKFGEGEHKGEKSTFEEEFKGRLQDQTAEYNQHIRQQMEKAKESADRIKENLLRIAEPLTEIREKYARMRNEINSNTSLSEAQRQRFLNLSNKAMTKELDAENEKMKPRGEYQANEGIDVGSRADAELRAKIGQSSSQAEKLYQVQQQIASKMDNHYRVLMDIKNKLNLPTPVKMS